MGIGGLGQGSLVDGRCEVEREGKMSGWVRASCGRLGLLQDSSENGRSQAWSAGLEVLWGRLGNLYTTV